MEEWGTIDSDEISKVLMSLGPPYLPIETWCKLKLPYKVPSCPPLPSLDEIEAGLEMHSLNGRIRNNPVFRFGNTVVKCSTTANILEVCPFLHPLPMSLLKEYKEAETILFLAEKCPQLRIPNILAVWTDIYRDGNVLYCFMMDFIEGIKFRSDNFAELPVHAQNIICSKVSAQIRLLRSIPSEGYYGRVHGQGWMEPPPGLMASPKNQPRSLCGPYKTYEEYISAMYDSWERSEAVSNYTMQPASMSIQDGWQPAFDSLRMDLWTKIPDWNRHEPKFTWLDPKFENMIVQPIHKDDGTEDWDVFLIDWECCGWFPAWLQAMTFRGRCGAFVRTQDCQPYKKEEIQTMMLKDFDPNPELKSLDIASLRNYRFY
jgi:hypothetical protein